MKRGADVSFKIGIRLELYIEFFQSIANATDETQFRVGQSSIKIK